jgi:hypothetical protein
MMRGPLIIFRLTPIMLDKRNAHLITLLTLEDMNNAIRSYTVRAICDGVLCCRDCGVLAVYLWSYLMRIIMLRCGVCESFYHAGKGHCTYCGACPVKVGSLTIWYNFNTNCQMHTVAPRKTLRTIERADISEG